MSEPNHQDIHLTTQPGESSYYQE